MTKTYRSKTTVSVSVVLSSGKSLHVSFSPLSNGSSVYVTDSAEIQNALERHARFGSLFILASERSAPKARTAKPAKAAAEKKVTTIRVSDWGAAKDYLADRFGISRTALRSHQSILDAAARNAVAFDGLA